MTHIITRWGESPADILSYWLEDRFSRDGERWVYSMSLMADDPQTLVISDDLYEELKSIFVSRREQYIQRQREKREQREKAVPATEKQISYIRSLMARKNAEEFELAKPVEELNLGEAKRLIGFLKNQERELPKDVLIQTKPIVRGRVYEFPKR